MEGRANQFMLVTRKGIVLPSMKITYSKDDDVYVLSVIACSKERLINILVKPEKMIIIIT